MWECFLSFLTPYFLSMECTEPRGGLSCDLHNTLNKCPCIFPTSEPHLFREYITGHLFVLQGRAYLYVLPALYLWPPYKRPLSIFFLLSTIDLLASRHFWTLKVVKKEEMMLGYVHFLQDVRCMSTSLSEFPDGLWPSAQARRMNLKRWDSSAPLSGPDNVGELCVKAVSCLVF